MGCVYKFHGRNQRPYKSRKQVQAPFPSVKCSFTRNNQTNPPPITNSQIKRGLNVSTSLHNRYCNILQHRESVSARILLRVIILEQFTPVLYFDSTNDESDLFVNPAANKSQFFVNPSRIISETQAGT